MGVPSRVWEPQQWPKGSDGGRLWGISGSKGDLVVLGHSRGPSRVWGPWGALRALVGRASLRVVVLEGPCRVRVRGVQWGDTMRLGDPAGSGNLPGVGDPSESGIPGGSCQVWGCLQRNLLPAPPARSGAASPLKAAGSGAGPLPRLSPAAPGGDPSPWDTAGTVTHTGPPSAGSGAGSAPPHLQHPGQRGQSGTERGSGSAGTVQPGERGLGLLGDRPNLAGTLKAPGASSSVLGDAQCHLGAEPALRAGRKARGGGDGLGGRIPVRAEGSPSGLKDPCPG